MAAALYTTGESLGIVLSDELKPAFHEAYAVSRGTRARQYLFSLSLNPPPNEQVPVDTFEAAIEKTEQKLGLDDQPRAIVFHEKEGRRHAHVVWSRIDMPAGAGQAGTHEAGRKSAPGCCRVYEDGWKRAVRPKLTFPGNRFGAKLSSANI